MALPERKDESVNPEPIYCGNSNLGYLSVSLNKIGFDITISSKDLPPNTDPLISLGVSIKNGKLLVTTTNQGLNGREPLVDNNNGSIELEIQNVGIFNDNLILRLETSRNKAGNVTLTDLTQFTCRPDGEIIEQIETTFNPETRSPILEQIKGYDRSNPKNLTFLSTTFFYPNSSRPSMMYQTYIYPDNFYSKIIYFDLNGNFVRTLTIDSGGGYTNIY